MRFKDYNEEIMYLLVYYREDSKEVYNVGYTRSETFANYWIQQGKNRSKINLLEVLKQE